MQMLDCVWIVHKGIKIDAISVVLDQGYTVAEAARYLEILANMLGRWIKEYQANDNRMSFRSNGSQNREKDSSFKYWEQATQTRETDIK